MGSGQLGIHLHLHARENFLPKVGFLHGSERPSIYKADAKYSGAHKSTNAQCKSKSFVTLG